MDLSFLKPTIAAAIEFDELFVFEKIKGELQEHIREMLTEMAGERKEAYDYTISLDSEGAISCEKVISPGTRQGFKMDRKGIRPVLRPASAFDYFEKEVPLILESILTFTKRKTMTLMGILFHLEFPVEQDPAGLLRRKFATPTNGNLDALALGEKALKTCELDFTFEDDQYLRRLLVTGDSRKDRTIRVAYESRLEKRILIQKASQFSTFFKDAGHDYFMKNVANGLLQDILQLKPKPE